jgi:metal-dependent amidase/aminoacylase/carboxypeptidase family protein
MTSSVHETIAVDLDLIDLYKDLHSHPELGFHEQRSSSLVERHLTALGFDTTTGVGTTGVRAMIRTCGWFSARRREWAHLPGNDLKFHQL